MSDYHRSAYVRVCQKRNDDRKELITKIKIADLIAVSLRIRHLEGEADKGASYRDGLMDAFGTVCGTDEAVRLWKYLGKRRERMKRLINHMRRVKMGGEQR